MRYAVSALDGIGYQSRRHQHPNREFRSVLGLHARVLQGRRTLTLALRHADHERRRSRDSADDVHESEARLRKALDATADLAIEHPNIPKHYLLRKKLHEYMGRVLRKQDKLAEAISQYEQSIRMQRTLIRKSECPEIHHPWLYRLLLDHGKLLRDAEQYEAAKLTLTTTARDLETLVAKLNRQKDTRHDQRVQKEICRTLEKTYLALANVLEKLEDPEGAAAMMQKAENVSW